MRGGGTSCDVGQVFNLLTRFSTGHGRLKIGQQDGILPHRGYAPLTWALLLLSIPGAFIIWSIHSGVVPIFMPHLWPHSYLKTQWNAHVKDALESRLRDLVCDGTLDLTEAQLEISSNWIAAYKKYFHTDRPLNSR